MNSCKITYIYGLYEVGKEDEIRYVGKTNNPIKRLRDHKNDKRLTSYKSCWVKGVISKGGDIGIKILKIVSQDCWKEKEIETIKEYRDKFKLVNLTDGGDGTMNNIYNKSFDECKLWLELNKPDWVKGLKEYKAWSKMKDFPDFLPKAPNRVFIDWTTWGDYLGTGSIHTMSRKDIYLSYEEAKRYLKENFNFKSSVDFKNSKLPVFIPKKPYNIYTEWLGWHEFLDYVPFKRTNVKYLDYNEAIEWISNNFGHITSKDYREKSKKNEIPIFLPKKPERVYKNFNWCEFLSNNGKKKNKSFYLNYTESMSIVHTLNIKTNAEWRKWCKIKPKEFVRIPSSPSTVYKEEWKSWFEWLGN
jgi:hypothetical protein